MNHGQIIAAWNVQADEHNQWNELGEDEKVEFAYMLAKQQTAEQEMEPQPARYVALKASGSRYAYVNDTQEGVTVKRYDVLKDDGWGDATKHAARLNQDAARAQRADKGDGDGR